MKIEYPNISQEELDWRFVRLLGCLEYDEFKWDQTAGDPAIFRVSDKGVFIDRKMSMENYITEFLEISLEEYRLLRYKVRVQHAISGLRGDDWSCERLRTEQRLEPFKVNMEIALGKELTEEEFECL